MSLHVVEHGAVDGTPIVFLHGAAVNGAGFHTVATLLPELHCLLVDLPGHGRSTGEFSVPTAALALAPLLESFGGRAVLVGHSLGGQVASEVIAQRRELVAGVILLGPIVDGFPWLDAAHAVERLLPHRPVRFPAHNVLLRIAETLVHVPRSESARWGADLQLVRPDAFVRAIVASLAYRMPDALDRFDGDALIIVAEDDYWFVHRSGDLLARAMPRARLVVARSAPHTWHLEEPTLLVDTIRAFLTRQPLPPELEAVRG